MYQVDAEQFGAVGNGINDDSAAWQAAIEYAQNTGSMVSGRPGKRYRLGTGLVFKHGTAEDYSITYHARIDGRGCMFLPDPGVTAITVDPLCKIEDVPSRRGDADIEIRRLEFDGPQYDGVGYSDEDSVCIRIGKAGYWCSSYQFAQINDVLVRHGFTGKDAIIVEDSRHQQWSGVSVRAGTVVLKSETPGGFVGDIVMEGCEFAPHSEAAEGGDTSKFRKPFEIYVNGGTDFTQDSAKARGIHLNHCYIYFAGTTLFAVNNSQVGDIWFDGCQFDQQYNHFDSAMYVLGDGNCKIFQLHILNSYFVGYTGTALLLQVQPGTDLNMVNIEGCMFNDNGLSNSSGATIIRVVNADSIRISGNVFRHIFDQGLADNSLISIMQSRGIHITDNQAVDCHIVGSNYEVETFARFFTSDRVMLAGNSLNIGALYANPGIQPITQSQIGNNLVWQQ